MTDEPEEIGTIDDDEVPPTPAETVTTDAASRRGLKRQETKRRREEREAEDFWRGALADPVGRRVIFGLLADCHTFETRFAAGPAGFPDPLATWFQAGEKATGERLYMTLLRLDPAGVLAMLQEHDPRLAKPKTSKRTETDG